MPAPDIVPRYRWIIIAQIWLIQGMSNLIMIVLGVLLPGMQRELGFGPIESGWMGAARIVGQALIFPASLILVRFAPVRVYLFCAGLATVAALLIGGAPGVLLVLVGLALFSTGIAFSQVPSNLIRLQWVPRQEMGTVWGIGMSLSAMAQITGLAVVPQILGLIGGWRNVFFGTGAMLALLTASWLLTGRERQPSGVSTARTRDRSIDVVRQTLRRRPLLLLGIGALGGMMAYMTTLLFLPTYLVQERNLSLEVAGLIAGAVAMGGLLGGLLSGIISDRIGRRKPLIWPAGLILPPLYVLLLQPLPPIALGCVGLLLGFWAWAPFPALSSIPFELPDISPAEVAVGQSLIMTIGTFGTILGPVLVGFLAAATGEYRLGMLVMAAPPALLAISSIWLPETGRRASR